MGGYFLNSSIVCELKPYFYWAYNHSYPFSAPLLPLTWLDKQTQENQGLPKADVQMPVFFVVYRNVYVFLKDSVWQVIECFVKEATTKCPPLKDPVDIRPHAQCSFFPPGSPLRGFPGTRSRLHWPCMHAPAQSRSTSVTEKRHVKAQ